MIDSLAHSRAPTNFSSQPPKSYKDQETCQFYVIDSENQEQLHHYKQKKKKQSLTVTSLGKEIIQKKRSQSHSSYNPYLEQLALDSQIKLAQEEVKKLQKQCKLLETLINDMAVEQAKLLVQIRVKERGQSINRARNRLGSKNQCPIHSNKPESLQFYSTLIEKINLMQQQKHRSEEISFTTPLLSKNQNTFCKPNLDEAKTVDISEKISKRKQQPSRPTSNKKQTHSKQNRQFGKQKSKKSTQRGKIKKQANLK